MAQFHPLPRNFQVSKIRNSKCVSSQSMLYNKMNLVQACLNMSELVLGIFSSPVIKLFQQIGCEICTLLLTLQGFDHLYHYPFFVLYEKKPSRALISPTQNGGSNPLSYFSFRLRVVRGRREQLQAAVTAAASLSSSTTQKVETAQLISECSNERVLSIFGF